MQIYDCLAADHKRLLELVTQLVESKNLDEGRWRDMMTLIGRELPPHMEAEEAVLYKPIRAFENVKRVEMRAEAGHTAIDELWQKLKVAKFSDARWRDIAKKLKKTLKHHITEEEGEILSTARILLTDAEAEALGHAFVVLKGLVQETNIHHISPEMLATYLPDRLRKMLERPARSTEKSL